MMDNISLGVMLVDLREKMGLTQDDIANKIHVRKTVIIDIENDQLPHVPFVFIKGYIRSYAEIVGLSSDYYQPYLNELTKQSKSHQKITQIQTINRKRRRKTPFILWGIFVILCVLGMILYYVNKDNKNNLIEVSHYISPVPVTRVNS
ncbi:helix-turn-helix domain-containing protein [Gilliamella sp. Gris1-4]|uniref:helix-turn-helix domain-containing protein n=1 Tax=Gilliamella sp. Gris1-4 TaxID=3120244 RepID=UPI0009BD4AC0|nr:helix-turn-helix domain-containing protein [Gilliamella apicola]